MLELACRRPDPDFPDLRGIRTRRIDLWRRIALTLTLTLALTLTLTVRLLLGP